MQQNNTMTNTHKMQTRSQSRAKKQIVYKDYDSWYRNTFESKLTADITNSVSKPVTRSQTNSNAQANSNVKTSNHNMQTRSKTKIINEKKKQEMNEFNNGFKIWIGEFNTWAENNSDSDYNPESDDEIDFDEASRAWRQNKTHIGNGMFKYNTRSRSRA
jgi:hypothetical protein